MAEDAQSSILEFQGSIGPSKGGKLFRFLRSFVFLDGQMFRWKR
jgi:hypothetical protein